MTDAVLVSRDMDVATVTLNRPERMNALDKAMWMRLGAVMRELDADDALRCIVLRGAGGKAFAAGADISEFANERANAAQARRYGEDVAGSMRALAECRHPTVALIEGACVGGGLLIASQCDLRICNESARFGVPVKNLGLTEAYDELQGMMRVIGPAASLRDPARGPHLGRARGLREGTRQPGHAGCQGGGGSLRRSAPHRGRRAAGGALAQEVHPPAGGSAPAERRGIR